MLDDRFTIRLTGRRESIPSTSYLIVLRNVLLVLRDINVAMTDDHKANMTWDFSKVSMSSPMTTDMFPIAADGNDIGKQVITACAEGLRQLEITDESVPRFFQQRTLKYARAIVGVLRDGIGKIEVETPYTPTVNLTGQLGLHARMASRTSYTDYGTFEGVLEVASIKDGTKTSINDTIYGSIPCQFDAEITESVRDSWTRRVSVFGLTTYTRSGTPRSIKVERIIQLRSQADLPQWEALRSLNVAAIDIATYTRRGRHAR